MQFTFLLLLLFVFQSAPQKDQQVNMQLKDIKGQQVVIDNFTKQPATVIWFISPVCPICQNYTLTMNALKKRFKATKFIAVVSGNQFNKTEMSTFQKDYQLSFPICLDPQKSLSSKLHATVTPEVFVYNQKGMLVYQGRIDNWMYDIGKKRQVITVHDLEDVLTKLNKHESLQFHHNKAIGCYIE